MPRYYGNQNAGVGLSLFSPTFRANTPFVDLSVVQNTYNTLEQGHHKAIAQAAAYKEALAQMDLNEAEDGWRQQLIDEIDSALTNNTQYGNSYAALDDIVKTYGDIKGNAGLIGRLRAQQQYKTYLDELSKSDLTEEQKDYFKEMNPYYYQDKVDNKGRVIGGTSWKPIEQYVDNIDQNKIISDAIQSLQPDSSEGESIWFGAKDGRGFTQTFEDSDGVPYFKKGNSYIRVSQDRIQSAIDAAIENTPGARASLMQDYKIAKWRHGKQSTGTVDDTTDDNGNSLNYEQYLQKRFKGYLHSRTYNRTKSTISTEAGMESTLLANKAKSAKKSSGSGDSDYTVLDDIYGSPGYSILKKEAQVETHVGNQFKYLKGLRDYDNDMGLNFDLNNPTDSYNTMVENIKRRAVDGKLTEKDARDITLISDLYDNYMETVNKVNQIIDPVADKKIKDNLDLLSVFDCGEDLSVIDNSNTAKQEYNKLPNKAFKSLGITDDNPEANTNVNPNFLRKQFPNEEYKNYGLDIKIKNGKEVVTINKNSYDYLPMIAKTFGKAYTATVPMVGSITGGGGYAMLKSVSNPLYDIEKFYNKLADTHSYIGEGLEIVQGTKIIPIEDIVEWTVEHSADKFSDKKSAREDAQNRIMQSFDNLQGSKLTMYLGVGDAPAMYIDDEKQKNAITDLIKNIKINTSSNGKSENISYGVNQLDGFDVVMVTLPTVTDSSTNTAQQNRYKQLLKDAGLEQKNGKFVVYFDNPVDSKSKREWRNSPEFKYRLKLSSDVSSGIKTWNNPDGSILTLGKDDLHLYQRNENSAPIPVETKDAIKLRINADKINEMKKKVAELKATKSFDSKAIVACDNAINSIIQNDYGLDLNSVEGINLKNQLRDIIVNFNY